MTSLHSLFLHERLQQVSASCAVSSPPPGSALALLIQGSVVVGNYSYNRSCVVLTDDVAPDEEGHLTHGVSGLGSANSLTSC